MGFHVCEYCKNETSSGDVILAFESGRVWVMPDMILHYIADHFYLPPDEFVDDVLNGKIREGRFTIVQTTEVGYLAGDNFSIGESPAHFFMRLWSLMRQAAKNNQRSQTRGLSRRQSKGIVPHE